MATTIRCASFERVTVRSCSKRTASFVNIPGCVVRRRSSFGSMRPLTSTQTRSMSVQVLHWTRTWSRTACAWRGYRPDRGRRVFSTSRKGPQATEGVAGFRRGDELAVVDISGEIVAARQVTPPAADAALRHLAGHR